MYGCQCSEFFYELERHLIKFNFQSDNIFHLAVTAFTAFVFCNNTHCLATFWKQCTGFRKHLHIYMHIDVLVKRDS